MEGSSNTLTRDPVRERGVIEEGVASDDDFDFGFRGDKDDVLLLLLLIC